MSDMDVGFIGLGNQGAPIARMIARGGFPLTVWARRPEAAAALADAGAVVAGSPADVAAASDVVALCVTADDDVRDMVAAMTPALRPGSVVVVHSTILPATVLEVASELADRGIDLVDAPVMGGGRAALEHRLMVTVGARADVLDRVRPVLDTFADPVRLVGEVGAGQVMKLVFNLMHTATLAMYAEAADLCEGMGLDRGTAAESLDFIKTSSMAYDFARLAVPPDRARHSAEILAKDVSHALAVIGEAGLDAGALGAAGLAGLEALRRRAAAADGSRT